VIGADRELAVAENDEVRARAFYAKALIQFELATGTILDRNDIELSDATRGQIPARDVSPAQTGPPPTTSGR
jgi:hypothetical protein